MKHFFITGTSSGIGKALAEEALAKGHHVMGFSRRQSIEHEHYKHIKIDLTDLNSFVSINFEDYTQAHELVLVNNAGSLGDIKPVKRLNPDKVIEGYSLNVIAPSILCQLFLSQTQDSKAQKSIINISSGAAYYPIPSWSTYCASKAALNMFSKVLKVDHPEINCHSIAPGIVDTAMQGVIRGAHEEDFPELRRFIDYKKSGELATAQSVAQKLMYVLNNPQKFPEVCFSLRDVNLESY